MNPGSPGSAVLQPLDNNGQIAGAPKLTIYTDGRLDSTLADTEISQLIMQGGEVRLGTRQLTLQGDLTISPSVSDSKITSTNFVDNVNLDGVRVFIVNNGTALYDLDLQAGIANGVLVKKGAGTLRLAGAINPNSNIALNAGTLALARDFPTALLIVDGGTIVADGADRVFGGIVLVTGDATIGTSFDGVPRLLTLTGPITLSVNTTLTLKGTDAVTFNGVITGSGGIHKTGSGTLMLSGANTFTGGLHLQSGPLNVAGDSNLGALLNIVTLDAGVLTFAGSTATARTFNLAASATLTAAPGTTITYNAGAKVNGGKLGAGGTHLFANGSQLSSATALIGSALSQTSGTAGFDDVTLRGAFTQSAGATLNATNGLTLTTSGSLALSGTTNLLNGGELDGVTTINNAGKLLTSGGKLYLGGGSRTTVSAGGEIGGGLSGSIELNGGLLTNNGVQSGTLNVNFGSLAKGAGTFGTVNLADGGRFAPGNSLGTATTSGDFTFGSGGLYEFELNSALATPGNGADFLSVAGILNVNAGTTANSRFTLAIISLSGSGQPSALSDFNPFQAHSFTLATAAAGVTGFAPGEFSVNTSGFLNSLEGGSFSVVQQGNDLGLNFAPIPEPATGALLLAGLTLLARRRREATPSRLA